MNYKKTIIFFSLTLILIFLGLAFYFFVKSSNFVKQIVKVEKIIYNQSLPDDLDFYENAFKFKKKELFFGKNKIIAGIIPHHLLAADLIAEFFHNVKQENFDSIILIGPNHFSAGGKKIISSNLDWQTPYGVLEYDQELAINLIDDSIEINNKAIQNDHAINSETAFIKKTFPDSLFLPLILKSDLSLEDARDFGKKLNNLVQNKNVLVLASVDFSHYKDSETAQVNDLKSINVIQNSLFDEVYNLDIDSPPTISVLLEYANLNQAEFVFLNNSNSALLAGKPDLESTTSYLTSFFVKNFEEKMKVVESEEIKMLFFGDMMLDRHVGKKIKEKGLDYIFGKLDQENFFSGYDLIAANLEGAVTNNGDHRAPIKSYDFAFHPDLILGLKKYNFNFFNLANNHIDDQGLRGIKETRENLDKLGIYYSGDINNIISKHSAKIIEINNTKIGMLGLCSLWGNLNKDELEKKIEYLASSSKFIIANIHWGEEYEQTSNKSQKSLAHFLIDSGVDVIIGHHPHVIQETEIYKDKPIFYSLGNFVFDQYFSEETQRGLAVEIIFNDQNIDYRTYLLKSKLSQIEIISD